MTLNTEISTLDGNDKFGVYVARPEGEARGAIIVHQEIFGVNAGIRKKANDWAQRGYLAVAPDAFWRQEPGIELNPDVEVEFQQALNHMNKYDVNEGVKDIESVIHWIRNEHGIEKVGFVGFCLGGKVAYVVATRTDIDATVGYYGVMIDQMLDEKHAIANPLMLHIPTEDHFVDKDAQAAMHEGLDDHPKVTLYDYEGQDHGFATEFGQRRVEEAATLADKRTEEFFAEHIG